MLVCKKGQDIRELSEKPFQISVVLYSLVENLILYLINNFLSLYFSPSENLVLYNLFENLILHLITDSPFLVFQPSENLPELIERTVFHTYGRLINNTYKRKMRSLVFILKHRDSIREKVVTGEISVKKLVSSSVEQLT